MYRMTGIGLGLFLAAVMVVGGCKGKQPAADTKTVQTSNEWWNHPGDVARDYLATVGASPIMSEYSKGNARNFAEVDARGKMAATLKAKINSLAENWAKESGDLTKQASFSSYVNNENFTRQYVDAEIKGAVAHDYHDDGKIMYVLMVLKNPSQWTANVADTLADQVLKDETVLKTEVMKQDFRKKMDELKDKEVQATKEQQAKFAGQYSSAAK